MLWLSSGFVKYYKESTLILYLFAELCVTRSSFATMRFENAAIEGYITADDEESDGDDRLFSDDSDNEEGLNFDENAAEVAMDDIARLGAAAAPEEVLERGRYQRHVEAPEDAPPLQPEERSYWPPYQGHFDATAVFNHYRNSILPEPIVEGMLLTVASDLRNVPINPYYVVRATNHVFYVEGEHDEPTYGVCTLCFRSGPLGFQCGSCKLPADNEEMWERYVEKQWGRYVHVRFREINIGTGYLDAQFLSAYVGAAHEPAKIGTVRMSTISPVINFDSSLCRRFLEALTQKYGPLDCLTKRRMLKDDMHRFIHTMQIDMHITDYWVNWMDWND